MKSRVVVEKLCRTHFRTSSLLVVFKLSISIGYPFPMLDQVVLSSEEENVVPDTSR